MKDYSIKQEQNERKISVCNFKTRGERRATEGDKRRKPSIKGMKEESGGKKVDSFEIFIYVKERTFY